MQDNTKDAAQVAAEQLQKADPKLIAAATRGVIQGGVALLVSVVSGTIAVKKFRVVWTSTNEIVKSS